MPVAGNRRLSVPMGDTDSTATPADASTNDDNRPCFHCSFTLEDRIARSRVHFLIHGDENIDERVDQIIHRPAHKPFRSRYSERR